MLSSLKLLFYNLLNLLSYLILGYFDEHMSQMWKKRNTIKTPWSCFKWWNKMQTVTIIYDTPSHVFPSDQTSFVRTTSLISLECPYYFVSTCLLTWQISLSIIPPVELVSAFIFGTTVKARWSQFIMRSTWGSLPNFAPIDQIDCGDIPLTIINMNMLLVLALSLRLNPPGAISLCPLPSPELPSTEERTA